MNWIRKNSNLIVAIFLAAFLFTSAFLVVYQKVKLRNSIIELCMDMQSLDVEKQENIKEYCRGVADKVMKGE